MNPEDFEFVADFLKKRSGIALTTDKSYLVESRLLPLARKRGLKDISEVVGVMRSGRDKGLIDEVLDAMTTNETFFFRDTGPFDRFHDNFLPGLIEGRRNGKALKIWCAAASTGQEPYSIAMILKEQGIKLGGWNLSILGTDISRESLKRANDGHYSQFEVQRGLPIQLLLKYFQKKDSYWEVSSQLKSMVAYREFNLLDSFIALGKFDVVFCRNVLIYFDVETKADILARIRRQMTDDGILILGGAETVINVSDHFMAVPGQRGFYAVNTAAA